MNLFAFNENDSLVMTLGKASANGAVTNLVTTAIAIAAIGIFSGGTILVDKAVKVLKK